ncbi:MAG: PDGLE domain-containing protein [Methanoregula sp.]|jgi:cobalt/nickel transport protein|nr:PDGLE domain-containing protein [Methanoregula sp.]
MMDNKTFIIAGIIVALLIGALAVFLASGDPDGLESTALVVQGQKTITGDTPADAEIHEETAGRFSYSSPMPDYSLGDSLGPLGGLIAIIVGTILAFLVVLGLAYGIKLAGKPAP